LKFRFTVLLQL